MTALLIYSILAILTPSASAQAPEDLAWLVGSWRSESDDRIVEEWWTVARGGLMLGLNRDHRTGSQSPFFEYLRIELDEEEVRYVASPRGSGETVFLLAKQEARRVVFENPLHDWPQRLTYELADGKLHLRAEGLEAGSRVARWELERVD